RTKQHPDNDKFKIQDNLLYFEDRVYIPEGPLRLRVLQSHRLRKESPVFHVGDKVWLLRRNIKTSRPCDKLDYRRLGPFCIQEKINPVAYRLELPASMKVHPVFHVSLLESYKESTISGRLQPSLPSVEVENHEEYEVEEVLDSRRRRGKLQYLIHWRGYDISERTWELAANLANAPLKVQEFHQRYPEKPKP
ncbi:hypothetical protein KC19_1G257000, partial [Ceratodon purpureus]